MVSPCLVEFGLLLQYDLLDPVQDTVGGLPQVAYSELLPISVSAWGWLPSRGRIRP